MDRRVIGEQSDAVLRTAMPGGDGEGSYAVMPGLVPGIHDLLTFTRKKDVDGRDKPGHDEFGVIAGLDPEIRAVVQHGQLPYGQASLHSGAVSIFQPEFKKQIGDDNQYQTLE
jgi:hypothetical protein